MPIYEYECPQCSHRFEYLVLRTTPPAECPSCGNKDLKQLISLCTTSTESTRDANYKIASQKAASVHRDKQHEEHKHLHEHFGDHHH